MRAPKVFISYSPRDAQVVAQRLHSCLTRHYDVWQDIRMIRQARPWDEEIEAGLRSSKAVVYLITPQSVREKGSPGNKDNTDSVCRDELNFARDHGIPIVPVRVLPCDTPLLICRLQQVDFRRWEESEASFDAGVRRICKTVDAVLRGATRERAWGRLPIPWDFEPYLREDRRGFIGREWLFAEIEEWLSNGNEKALLITGDPGVGKSAMVAELVRRNPDGQVLAYYCCRADTKATTDPAVFVRSLAAMLAARLDGFEAMLETPEIRRVLDKADEDPGSAFEAAILGPLTKLSSSEASPRYLLIDALDEALTSDRRTTIVELLSTRLNRLPPWLRIMATTRRDPKVLARLKHLRVSQLSAEDPRNLNDVRQFVLTRLRAPELRPQVEADGRPIADIAEGFLRSGAGNFLIVSTTLEAVHLGHLTLAQAEALPPEMDVRYLIFFDRLFSKADVDYKPTGELLDIVLAAAEPLRPSELAAVSSLDEDYDLAPMLERLSAFLQARDGRLVLFHNSLADWLTGKDVDGVGRKAGDYHVNRHRGHVRLAQWCWTESHRATHTTPLYCFQHLPRHLIASGRREDLHALLSFDSRGKHVPWYETLLRFGMEGTFRDHVEYAAQLDRHDYANTPNGKVLARSIYYTVIRSSLNSAADALPPQLPALMVAASFWTEARAVRQLEQYRDRSLQLLGVAALAELRQPGSDRDGFLSLGLSLSEGEIATHGPEIVSKLAALFSPCCASEVLSLLGAIKRPDCRVEAASALLPFLPTDKAQELALVTFAVLRSFLPALKERLGKNYHPQNYLNPRTSSKGTPHDAYLRFECRSFASLVPFLPKPKADAVLLEAISTYTSVSELEPMVEALSYILPVIPVDARFRQLDLVLDAANSEPIDQHIVAKLIVSAAKKSDPETIERIMAIARTVLSEPARTAAVVELFVLQGLELTVPEAEECVRALVSEQHEVLRARLMSQLLPILPQDYWPQVLSLAESFSQLDSWDLLMSCCSGLQERAPDCSVLFSRHASLAEQSVRALAPPLEPGWIELLLSADSLGGQFRAQAFNDDSGYFRMLLRGAIGRAATIALKLPDAARAQIADLLFHRATAIGDQVEQLMLRCEFVGPHADHTGRAECVLNDIRQTQGEVTRARLLCALSENVDSSVAAKLIAEAHRSIDGKEMPELQVVIELARHAPELARRPFLNGFMARALERLQKRDSSIRLMRGGLAKRLAEACALVRSEEACVMANSLLEAADPMSSGDRMIVTALVMPLLRRDSDEFLSNWSQECLKLSGAVPCLALLVMFEELDEARRDRLFQNLHANLPGVGCGHCRELYAAAMALYTPGESPMQITNMVCAIREDALFISILHAMTKRSAAWSDRTLSSILPRLLHTLSLRPRPVCLIGLARLSKMINRRNIYSVDAHLEEVLARIWNAWP